MQPISHQSLIVITGAAGLVGQNLLLLLRESGYKNLLAIDVHAGNLAIAARLNPGLKTLCVDLSVPGDWQNAFESADAVVLLHARITALNEEDFGRDNIEATRQVLEACQRFKIPYMIHVSSSVMHSVVHDAYSRTKRIQEELVLNSGIKSCILRPTIMFGWFDSKHFGWLSRFMERTPVFPIPGDGKYIRQPLYNRDFCRVIIACLESDRAWRAYDIVGTEDIFYVDIIKAIRQVKDLQTLILLIPCWFFDWLLCVAARISRKPPFTSSQLHALMAGDYFSGVDIKTEFGVTPTPFSEAMRETFTHPVYSCIAVER